RPSFRGRWRTETRGSRAAIASASSPVPSGELSSITRMRSSAPSRSSSAASISSTFSRSLYVGRQTVALGTRPMIAPMAAALPQNDVVVEQLELLADLLELEGQEAFRVLAYRRAALRVRESGGSIAQLALDGKAKELQGIGKTIEEKIVQIVEQGEIEALAKRRKTIPPDVVQFMRLPGLGPKTARRIWQELGVETLAELKTAAEQERLR